MADSMTLKEAAAARMTRLTPVADGKPLWNKYSFCDIDVFADGTHGPWVHIYDPCGSMACGKPAWKSIDVVWFQLPAAEFRKFVPPDDMAERFPGVPPVRPIISGGV